MSVYSISKQLQHFHKGGGEGAWKKNLPKEEGRESGGKKSAHSAPTGARARSWDLPYDRRRSPAARHGSCLNK